MSLKLRLARGGTKKRPFYRVVVADARSPRDGRFIEKLGTYNPLLPRETEDRVTLNIERVQHWLSMGAKPTDRVLRFLDAAGVLTRPARNNPNKAKPGKKALERLAAEREAAENPVEAEVPVAAEPAGEAPADEAPVEAEAEAPAADEAADAAPAEAEAGDEVPTESEADEPAEAAAEPSEEAKEPAS